MLIALPLMVLSACQFRSVQRNENTNAKSNTLLQYKVVLDTIMSDNNDSVCWFQPRAGVIPGNPSTIVMTLQRFIIGHSDVYKPLVYTLSNDNGMTWSSPGDAGDAFAYQDTVNGVYTGQCDFTPEWNEYSGTLLTIGHTVHYKNQRHVGGMGRTTVYSVYDPDKQAWTKCRKMKMPNDPAFYNSGGGAAQRVDLPGGYILLPIYFKPKGTTQYSTTVVKCFFDGKSLIYKKHGDFLTVNVARGLYEPSLTYYKGKYYLTMRNDSTGYYAVSNDGLHFSAPKIWHFDNGQEVGTYNTQQHWVTHSNGLFLVYTRRGANNNNVVRSRAPLFMAQVDTENMLLFKQTERILIPNRGAALGNFGVTKISKYETWVTAAEGMRKNRIEQMKQGADGNVFAARILWNKPNRHLD